MTTDPSTVRVLVEREDLVATLAARLAEGWRLALTSAREQDDRIRITHLLLRPVNQRLEIEVGVPTHDAWVPTLAGVSWAGGRFDREIRDLFGVEPRHHPLPRRMVRHGHWPTGWYPMRRDAGPVPDFPEDVGSYPFVHVEGPGVYEIPVGPVHAGLIEPGHFRFSVVGETIVRMKARLWFVHRGVEKHFEGRSPAEGISLAERISGDTAVGHALAYAMAVEQAAGVPVSERARTTGPCCWSWSGSTTTSADLGAIVNDVGFGIVHAHAQRLRESLLRHHEHLTGHRLLRGGITVGGATLRAGPDLDLLDSVAAEVAELVDISLDHPTVRDRLTGTAVLDEDSARQLDVLGYVARASGVDSDARRDHPFLDPPASWTPVLHEHRRRTGAVPGARRGDRRLRGHGRAELTRALAAASTDAAPVQPSVRLRRGRRRGLARHPGDPRRPRRIGGPGPSQDRRPVVLQLAGSAGGAGGHDRPRLPPGQQELQPVLRGQRPLDPFRPTGAHTAGSTTPRAGKLRTSRDGRRPARDAEPLISRDQRVWWS